MQLHSFGLGIIIAVATARASGAEPAAPASAPPSPDPAAQLCRGRAGCTVLRRRPIDKGAAASAIVDLRLAHAPDATDDEARCDRREYWLVTPTAASLLATDCETQWGADNPGPAHTELKGRELRVKYTEFQSSDACETVDAIITLAPAKLKQQIRRRGTVHRNACLHPKRVAETPPEGDGTPGHPILLLHR